MPAGFTARPVRNCSLLGYANCRSQPLTRYEAARPASLLKNESDGPEACLNTGIWIEVASRLEHTLGPTNYKIGPARAKKAWNVSAKN